MASTPSPAARAGGSPPTDAAAGDTLLAGATGLVGGAVREQWPRLRPGSSRLHLLARRALPVTGARERLRRVDFARLPALPRAAEAVCCLGTTIAVAGSQAAFRAVDHDAVVAFARAARAAGATRFALVSSLGADPRARTFYSRVKGEAEAAVAALGFDSLVIARPSLLAGDRARLSQPARAGERVALALARPLARLMPLGWRPIEADVVARALLRALAEAAPGVRVLDSASLQRLGA